MTPTAETQARQNSHGDPCPPWCVTGHSAKFHEACVSSPAGIGSIWTCAIRNQDGFHVALAGSLPDVKAEWPHLALSLPQAECMAVFAGLLAGATPDEHRKLAAAIRQAAATLAADGA
jgi:hypothetical protein